MEIYEDRKGYDYLVKFVHWIYRVCYRKIEYVNMDRIPQDAAIIYAPNHYNGLMDALAILLMNEPRKKVFVSRADIFHNHRIGAILRWMRIMPIHRVRDGLDQVRHNDATIQEAVRTLQHNIPFCIMVEGTHHADQQHILPLKKGVFRIALQAKETMGKKQVYIVPIRIEYKDLFHLWDKLRITAGDPIAITGTCEPVRVNYYLKELTERMQAQIQPDPWKKEHVNKLLMGTLLLVTSPFALLAATLCLPILIGEAGVRLFMEDECFYTSAIFVMVAISCVFTLGLVLIPWIGLEAWRATWRSWRNA